MTSVTDIHTHTPAPAPGRIVNIDPNEGPVPCLLPGQPYSAGIHPWRAPFATEADIAELERLVRLPEVVAVGETGLDRRRGDLATQMPLFIRHLRLADKAGKPVIVHCVAAWAELIEAVRLVRPRPAVIIHGFRGKPQLVRQLLDQGFFLSFGEHFNQAARDIIPPGRLLAETDTSALSPADILNRLGIDSFVFPG